MNQNLLDLFNSLDVDSPKENREQYVRAPFGYPGAKTKSVDIITKLLPYRAKYCEPFGGSGTILLARNESPYEIFNDRCSGITSFYRVLRERPDELTKRLELTLVSREEFIWCRDSWENCQDELERAARWYYTVQNSFTRQGRNFGRGLNTKMMINAYFNSFKDFYPCARRLRNVLIENQDWRRILNDFDSVDMVWYLDPPYYKVSKGVYKNEINDSEHKEILDSIQHLKGFVAISSYSNNLYNSYRWDSVHEWEVYSAMTTGIQREENKQEGLENIISRKNMKECLYIKEAKC